MLRLYLPYLADSAVAYWLGQAACCEAEDNLPEGAWCRWRAECCGGPKLTRQQRELYAEAQRREAEYWARQLQAERGGKTASLSLGMDSTKLSEK